MRTIAIIGIVLTLGLLAATTTTASAQEPGFPAAQEAGPPETEQEVIDQTPPRLSFIEGRISFWRPGAEDWTQAQINTPIAPGDQIYTSAPGNLEIQIGSRAFVRAWENTHIGLENQEPDFLQFKVTSGVAAFDLRTVEPGHTLEVDTPNATFVIEHAGYYRVNVNGDRTSFITRRSGEATVTPAGGETAHIAPSEEVVVEGTEAPSVTSFVAPKLDKWDKWNYARTDRILDAVSSRYVSQDMYGVDDLDKAGTWRVVPTYGAVWVPYGVPVGWAPYSNGSWVRDPYYGWSWVDAAPWGWAPYHYGRWVSVGGIWSWAPGPLVARPHYCPALVAFLGGPGGSIGINISTGPLVAWVALGWGEPVVPWWGPPHFHRRPYWGGWHGPRIVNNVVVHHTTVVHAHNINVYHNTSVHNAVVAVHGKHFGNGRITRERLTRVDAHSLRPIHESPRVDARPENYVPRTLRGNRPPDRILQRSVVSTRPPRTVMDSVAGTQRPMGPNGRPVPAPRIVSAPRSLDPATGEHRPPFGRSKVERSLSDRPMPPSPPKGAEARHSPLRTTTESTRPNRQAHPEQPLRPQPPLPPNTGGSLRQYQPSVRQIPQMDQRREPNYTPKVDGSAPQERQAVHRAPQTQHVLPGEPANRLSPSRGRGSSSQPAVSREAPRNSSGREPSMQRQVQPSPRQADPGQADLRQAGPRQRMGVDQNRGRQQ